MPARGPKSVALTVYRGVAPDVAAAVGQALAVYPLLSKVAHRIDVVLVPAPAVANSGGLGFGCCRIPEQSPAVHRQPVLIYVAGGMAEEIMTEVDTDCPREDAVAAVVDVLCHELAHYEQWRDGREVAERSADRRMRALAKRIRQVAVRETVR